MKGIPQVPFYIVCAIIVLLSATHGFSLYEYERSRIIQMFYTLYNEEYYSGSSLDLHSRLSVDFMTTDSLQEVLIEEPSGLPIFHQTLAEVFQQLIHTHLPGDTDVVAWAVKELVVTAQFNDENFRIEYGVYLTSPMAASLFYASFLQVYSEILKEELPDDVRFILNHCIHTLNIWSARFDLQMEIQRTELDPFIAEVFQAKSMPFPDPHFQN